MSDEQKIYLEKLNKMLDDELHSETKQKIWLSAYASNNPRSKYHWQVDNCYDEWKNRNNTKGYDKAYKEVYKETFG